MKRMDSVRTLLGGIGLVACTAALGVAATAAAGDVQKVPTTVEMFGAEPADSPPPRAGDPRLSATFRFYGRVTADAQKCAKLRKLYLFDRRTGPDARIGTGYSDTLGYWSINASSTRIEDGVVYAKAPKARRGRNTVCKAARSQNLVLTR